jgi:FKBP-type peptidyl-prolyl cis-trans isomerase
MKRVLAALVLLIGLVGCGGSDYSSNPSDGGGSLVILDLVVGTGATAAVNDTITVNYVGTLTNGQKFDSSYDRNQPLTRQLNSANLIEGWVQGVPGMKVGGKRRLTIPPSLGYGNQPQGSIPANSTLIFEIELLGIAGK